jgi:hypothetical protein
MHLPKEYTTRRTKVREVKSKAGCLRNRKNYPFLARRVHCALFTEGSSGGEGEVEVGLGVGCPRNKQK